MNVVGIIAEYNPFHNGHLHHLRESVKKTCADYSVCVMSGNFLQRGEPALYDKWIRAEAAVNNGIDLVLELPFAFACNSAEFFAAGAVSLLDRLGCVTHLSFGSENGEIDELYQAAAILSKEDALLSNYIKEFMSLGMSFPKAREHAVGRMGGQAAANAIKEPNNILGVEYLKALIRRGSKIEPVTVKRLGADYHDENIEGAVASATAIRNQMIHRNESLEKICHVIPKQTYDTLIKYSYMPPADFSRFFELITYKILSSSQAELEAVFSISEGLENRIKKCLPVSKSMEELIAGIKTKRYTQTRIQRALIHILFNLTKEKMQRIMSNPKCLYGRILAFSKKGAELIKNIKKNQLSSIPVITNINKETDERSDAAELLELDILASNVYNLVFAKEPMHKRSDFAVKPYSLL